MGHICFQHVGLNPVRQLDISEELEHVCFPMAIPPSVELLREYQAQLVLVSADEPIFVVYEDARVEKVASSVHGLVKVQLHYFAFC